MWPDLLRAAFALGLVILLILVFGAILRRFGTAGLQRQGKRLAVSESLMLDARRRLVLVRRDGREHLLLLGPGGDLVIETRVERPDSPAQPIAPQPPTEQADA